MSTARALELQELAWDFQARGEFDEAFERCALALALIEDAEGPQSADAANLLIDLADIENDRQRREAALVHCQRAQDILDAIGDDFEGETAVRVRARAQEMTGTVQLGLGNFAQAVAAFESALAITASHFDASSEEVADARNNLAVPYKFVGRCTDALRLYELALPSIVAAHGERSLEAAVVFHNIGGALHASGEFDKAEAPGRKAWDISRQLLGDDDPRTMLDAAAYAAILDGLHQYEECHEILVRVLIVMTQTHGAKHYEVAATLHNLAAAQCALGLVVEAERNYRQALVIKEQLLGSKHPDTALTCNNLGRLLVDLGRKDEAVGLLRSAVAVLTSQLAAAHPNLAAAERNLAAALNMA
jgi:tetratricopeptide (TPR) repeat protein